MADIDPVLSLTVDDQISTGATAITAALGKIGDAATVTETKVTRVTSANASFLKSVDPIGTAAAKITADIARLNSMFDAGQATQEQYSRGMATLNTRMRATNEAFAAAGPAVDAASSAAVVYAGRLAAMSDAAARAANYQAALNATFAAAPASQSDYDKRAADIAAYGNEMDRLRAKFSPLFAATQQYNSALAEIDDAYKKGAISWNEADAATQRTTASYNKTKAAMQDVVTANGQLADSHGKAGAAAGGAAIAHAGFTRELVVMGHEVVTGNYSRIPGSMMVLAERSGNLNQIISGIGSVLMGWPGIMAGAVAGLGLLAYSSESTNRAQLALQTSLRGTRDDFIAMAAEAKEAAHSVAQAGLGVTIPDASAAAKVLAANPAFQGTTSQLAALVTTANNLALVMGETLPEAATKLAAAMDAPGRLADDMAKHQFRGMNDELARSIDLQAKAGDAAGAYKRVLDVVNAATADAAKTAHTDLENALNALSSAFTTAGTSGKSFGQEIGESVTGIVSSAVNALADLVNNIHAVYNALPHMNPLAPLPSAVYNWATGGQPAGISGATADQIHMIGERNLQIPTNIVDFGTRIAAQESHGQQFGQDGKVLTSSRGAQGMFQLMPGTASDLGVDAADTTQNIAGGLTYIAQLWNKYNGDTTLVAMAYNWGPGNVDKFLAGTKTLAEVPKETSKYVLAVTGHDINPSLGGQPIDVSGATGVVNRPDKVIQDALTKAQTAGASGFSYAAASADAKDFTTALKLLADQGETSGTKVDDLNEALTKAQHTMADAKSPAAKLLETITMQTDGENAVAAAWSKGALAASDAANHVKALSDARSFAMPGTAAYKIAVADITDALNKERDAAQKTAAAQSLFDGNQQLQYLKAEQATLGETAQQRAVDLAVLKEQQTIEKSMPAATQAQKDAMVQQASAIASATFQLQQQQQALAELGNMATQIADQIGSAITQAFVSGQGAAVNWGNVMRGVLASVLQEIVKLAIINPIMNSITGNSATTLGSVVTALGNGGTGAGGSGGTGGLLNNVSNLYSAGKSIYNGGSAFGGYTGSIDSIGSSLAPGVFNTFEPAAYAALPEGVAGPVAGASDIGYLGTSASGALGAIGGVTAGYGIGSTIGGFEQSALHKTGPAPQIGAAAGAVGGALVGTFLLPGVGTVLGGVIGGAIGGAGGGLIGPHVQNSYSSTGLDTSGGLFSVGSSVYQQDANAGAEISQLQQQVAALNGVLTANGITVNSGHIQIGDNTPGGYQDPSKYASLDAAVAGGAYQFSAADPTLNSKLSGQKFASIADFQTWIAAFQATQTSAKAFITDTTTLLKNFGVVNGQLGDSIDSITKQYTDTKTAADALLATGNLSDQQTSDMADAETRLAQARDKAIAATNDAINQATLQAHQGLQSRYYNAQAAIGGPGAVSPQQAALYAFDIQAATQRTALTASLVNTFGTAFKTTATYAAEMGQLETTLGEERLAIAQQYADKLNQTAIGTVQSLTSFAASLATGNLTALSPSGQYALAASQFSRTASGAAHGNYSSLTGLSAAATSFLTASKTVNGSGAQYASDFASVETALETAAAASPDTLTASIFVSQQQTSTQQLLDALAALKAEVVVLRQQVTLGSALPARVSA